MGYYGYQKLTAAANIEGSYGEIDGQLGWKLKPNATSRYWMDNELTGIVLFDSLVHTDALGFRAAAPDSIAARDAIVAIGDSWTFGYALDYEESFPAQLAQILDRPVVNMAVPAYGSAQVLLLLERHLVELKPKVVVHLNLGLWNRSLCHGKARPTHILKPCFWENPATQTIELVAPQPGYVEGMAAKGVYPGGWLTAGNSTWSYYLISRPMTKLKQLLTVAGFMPGHQSEYDTDPVLGPKAIAYTLRRMVGLAQMHGFTFVLADPAGDYAAAYAALTPEHGAVVEYVSPARWSEEVGIPALRLPAHEQRIPRDGHYGVGKNQLIAEALARVITPLLDQK